VRLPNAVIVAVSGLSGELEEGCSPAVRAGASGAQGLVEAEAIEIAGPKVKPVSTERRWSIICPALNPLGWAEAVVEPEVKAILAIWASSTPCADQRTIRSYNQNLWIAHLSGGAAYLPR